MIAIRRSEERGHFDHGWLDTYHTFSFGDYFDPRFRGFRALRVLNEDWIQPGVGFPRHGHRDMEIVTYVLSGALRHDDSLGHGSVIRPGEVQRMTAGTGIEHGEANPSPTESVHLLQIWLRPERAGLTPGYEQRTIAGLPTSDGWRLVASPDGRDGSVTVHQDVTIHVGLLEVGGTATYPLEPGRHAWVQVARGAVVLNGHPLGAGAGAAGRVETALTLVAGQGPAEVLLFDLA